MKFFMNNLIKQSGLLFAGGWGLWPTAPIGPDRKLYPNGRLNWIVVKMCEDKIPIRPGLWLDDWGDLPEILMADPYQI